MALISKSREKFRVASPRTKSVFGNYANKIKKRFNKVKIKIKIKTRFDKIKTRSEFFWMFGLPKHPVISIYASLHNRQQHNIYICIDNRRSCRHHQHPTRAALRTTNTHGQNVFQPGW
jgi:hypothetical protein